MGKKITIYELLEAKQAGRKITAVSCYDYTTACLAVRADYGEEERDLLVIAKLRRHYDLENTFVRNRHLYARYTHAVDYEAGHIDTNTKHTIPILL